MDDSTTQQAQANNFTHSIKATMDDMTTQLAQINNHNDSDEDVGQALDIINSFLPWLIIVIGVLFNVLIVLAMRTKNFRSLSTSVYMTVGAVNDILSIPVLLFAHWLHVMFPDSIVRGSGGDGLCKFFNFYGWGQADLGMMLLSAMTADRAYVILRPMTTKDLVKRAKVICGICVCVVAAKDFHFLFSSVVVSLDRKDRLCDVTNSSASYNEFYSDYWPWVDAVFDTVCFVVMVVSNSVLIRHVRNSRKGRQIKTDQNSNQSECNRTSSTMSIHAGTKYNSVGNQVTRMLLGESLALILLSYPFSVHLIISSQIPDLQEDPDKAKANALAFNIVFYLLYSNKCVNFIVYSLAGRKFRKAVANEVLCRFRCGKFQFGAGRRASESGEGSFQNPTTQREQQSSENVSKCCVWRIFHCGKCSKRSDSIPGSSAHSPTESENSQRSELAQNTEDFSSCSCHRTFQRGKCSHYLDTDQDHSHRPEPPQDQISEIVSNCSLQRITHCGTHSKLFDSEHDSQTPEIQGDSAKDTQNCSCIESPCGEHLTPTQPDHIDPEILDSPAEQTENSKHAQSRSSCTDVASCSPCGLFCLGRCHKRSISRDDIVHSSSAPPHSRDDVSLAIPMSNIFTWKS